MTEPAHQSGLLVACLCATWCKTCIEFRDTFDKLAASEEIAGLPAALASQ